MFSYVAMALQKQPKIRLCVLGIFKNSDGTDYKLKVKTNLIAMLKLVF
jgi:hypothetical protein